MADYRRPCVEELRKLPTYFACIPRDISNMIDDYMAATGCIRRVAAPMQLHATYNWYPPPKAILRYLGLRLYYVEMYDYVWTSHSSCVMIIKHMLHRYDVPAPQTPSMSPIGFAPSATLDLRGIIPDDKLLPNDRGCKYYLDKHGQVNVRRNKDYVLRDPFGTPSLVEIEHYVKPGRVAEPSGQYNHAQLRNATIVGADAADNFVFLVPRAAVTDVVIYSAADPVVTVRSAPLAVGRASLGPDGHLHVACARTGKMYVYR